MAELLHGKRRKVSEIAVYVLMLTDFVLMVVSLAGAKGIYDTGIYWAAVQGAVSLLLLVLTVMEAKDGGKRRGLMHPSAIVLLTVLLLELVNSCTGWWRGGICIKIIFTVLFVFHLVRAAWLVAKNQQDSIRAEKLREEPSSCTHGRKTATASLRFPMTVWGLTWQMHRGRNLSE